MRIGESLLSLQDQVAQWLTQAGRGGCKQGAQTVILAMVCYIDWVSIYKDLNKTPYRVV